MKRGKNIGNSVNNQSKLQDEKCWTAQEIQDLIDKNKQDLAFIIGNGVNIYFKNDIHSENGENANIKCWNKLLLSLWNEEGSVKKLEKIPLGISFPEFFDLVDLKRTEHKDSWVKYDAETKVLCSNADDYKEKIKKIEKKRFYKMKKVVCDEMKNWEGGSKVEKFVSAIKGLETPLLTTNFDEVLSKSIQAEINYMRIPQKKKEGFTDYYPWICYYGDQTLESPILGFGIWHINGMICYSRSITLGLCDYMGCVTRARPMIQSMNFLEKENLEGKKRSYWDGYNTWLHVVFNKSLFIFGLALEENETFLRWLLIQRAKYFAFYHKSHHGWYVVGPKDKINGGKELFLESVGFKIIKIEDYKTIYEDVWK